MVGFEGGGEHCVSVSDPLAGDQVGLRLLAWYFEEHLRFPFLDRDRAREAEALIVSYGEALFAELFESNVDCAHELRSVRDGGFDGWRLEVVGSTAFQSMHWEALRGSAAGGNGVPVGVLAPIVRRVEHVPAGFTPQATGIALNVLVVTARPGGASDVGYRTISRPLLEALRQAQVPVNVDLVRPGSWSALVGQLRQASRAHGSGWYQVVHFDVHGAVATGEELATASGGRYRFSEGAAAEAVSGEAFLFFETAEDGVAEPVATQRVAELLVEHRVPVAVLNACQSAMQLGESEASLAQRLVEAGVPLSVGMAYSVTVSAAERMMPVIYEQLAAGEDVIGAVHDSRRALFDDRARRVYFDHDLDLEDWMLPVVFCQRDVEVQPRAATSEEAAAMWERRASRLDEPRPEYGFVGRDLDVQAIERRVLRDADANELLVRGMAGSGKSTLLEHLGWWWQTTGLVDRVFSFSYEDRAWTASQMLHAIAAEMLDPHEHAAFQTLSDDAQRERIVALLRAERHLLVLDNAESITAAPGSIPHSLDDGERRVLAGLLAKIRGGKTFVLIGSRGPEDWVAAESFGSNVHDLEGLDPQAASVLIDRIFTRNGIDHPTTPAERGALDELVRVLGGYPLMLTVVLPTLATAVPSQILEDLTKGGESADPERMIQRAVEVSHERLDPTAQNALLCFAPFTSVVLTGALEPYTALLAQRSEVAALGAVDMSAALGEAVRVGLASQDSERGDLIRLQPVLPYFLRSRLTGQDELAEALARAHYELYGQLARELLGLLMAPEPARRRTGLYLVGAEYANLMSAIRHALDTDQPVALLVGALEEYLNQTKQQQARRLLLDTAIDAAEKSKSVNRRELAILHSLAGIVALQQRALELAERHHSDELRLLEQIDERHGQGGAYHQLGVVAQQRRRFDEAEGLYRKALEIYVQFDDHRNAASTYHQLGGLAQQRRRFDEAGRFYRKALENKADKRHSAASTYHQLGRLAQLQRRFDEAERFYREALEIKLEFDDRHGAASTYHQLGVVAQQQQQQQQRRSDEAEGLYRKALEIYLEFDDRYEAADTYHQLGVVAQQERRLDEAEADYRKALEIFLEFDDRHKSAGSYHQLGAVAQLRGRFDEAEAYYRKALETYLEFNDRYEAGDTYHQLGVVAQLREQFGEAEAFYREAVEIFLEFDDRYEAADSYYQLGMVAQSREQFDEAESLYRKALATYVESDDRLKAALAHRRLGILLTEVGRIDDAIGSSLTALMLRRDAANSWSRRDLAWLKRQRRLLGGERFVEIVASRTTQELLDEILSLLDRVDEPQEDAA